METVDDHASPGIGKAWWMIIVSSAFLRWLSQPPLALWPAIFVAIVPLLILAAKLRVTRRHYVALLLASFCYWAPTLEGLRHANLLIYPCWLALAAYLSIYQVLFVVALRRASAWRIPLFFSAPVAWVGLECIRNYLLTGISVTMLGHSLADVPVMIQIADLGGTYAVSYVIVVVNVAVFSLVAWWKGVAAGGMPVQKSQVAMAFAKAILLVVATGAYGSYRLQQLTVAGKTTIALIGRDEPIEYVQSEERELEIFHGYLEQSAKAVAWSGTTIDAVVWPESMMTGGMPWAEGKGSPEDARRFGASLPEVQALDRRTAATVSISSRKHVACAG